MKLMLNKVQRAIVFVAAGTIILVQIIVFEEHGVDGHGWLLSLLAAAALLVLGFSSRGPTNLPKDAKARTDESLVTMINEGARSMAKLTAEFATHLEQHYNSQNLRLAVKLPGISLTEEAVLPVYTLASLAYLEAKDGKSMPEYVIYRGLIAKALVGFISQNSVRAMTQMSGQDPKTLTNLSGDLAKSIAALVDARLKAQYEIAQQCLALIASRAAIPLAPLYRSIPVGSAESDEVLQQRFGAALSTVLAALRRERASRTTQGSA